MRDGGGRDHCAVGEVNEQRPPVAGELSYSSRSVGTSDSEIGHPTPGQRMRVIAHRIPIVVAGHQITEAVDGIGIRQQFCEKLS